MVEKAQSECLNAKRGGNLLAPLKSPSSIAKKSASSSPKSANPSSRSTLSTRVYKGVRMRTWGKWVSEIREPNKRSRIWLGSFPTAEMAAKAYDAAVVCLRGPSATLNFPHCPPSDLPRCSTPRDVQAAAATAAAACAPPQAPIAQTQNQSENSPSENETQLQSQHSSCFDDIANSQESSKNMASEMEDWINAEFGCLEPLDEAHGFPELLFQMDLGNFTTIDGSSAPDESFRPEQNSPPSDGEENALYDHNLWCF